jgi:hypothetical protein
MSLIKKSLITASVATAVVTAVVPDNFDLKISVPITVEANYSKRQEEIVLQRCSLVEEKFDKLQVCSYKCGSVVIHKTSRSNGRSCPSEIIEKIKHTK